jgi:diguanylate cyclase (GGDEF)-like protein
MKLDTAIDIVDQTTVSAFANIKSAVEALVAAARTSDLTGLRNGLALAEDLSRAQAEAAGYHLLFGDLNGFKSINDNINHQAGDAALIKVGEILAMVTRTWNAVAYHKSGDEFAIIVPASTKHSLMQALEQYFVKVSFLFEGVPLEVSASFGCVEISSLPVDVIQARAEYACHLAKQKGRSWVVHEWSPDDVLEKEERRVRCDKCGTAFNCVLTGAHRSLKSLHCPVCQTDCHAQTEVVGQA